MLSVECSQIHRCSLYIPFNFSLCLKIFTVKYGRDKEKTRSMGKDALLGSRRRCSYCFIVTDRYRPLALSCLSFPVPSCSPRGKWPGIGLRAVSTHQVSSLQSGLIILSHKKEQNGVICREMVGPRLCHTEWRKSEREKQILYINAYMWL